MSNNCDIVLLCETHCNKNLLPQINGYEIIADPNFPESTTHGGIAGYIKANFYKYITNIRFSKCTLSFTFSFLPHFCYMMVYLYPVDSKNYDDTDFGTLAEEIIFWNNLGYTLYIGGDFNARLGDLNVISFSLEI